MKWFVSIQIIHNMISRKENLFVLPFQQRNYNSHRTKVSNALPRIDNTPPKPRTHVTYKRKKLQFEKERCGRIENDNFILLQHLGNITKTNRVDNRLSYSPPIFMHRIRLYRIVERKQSLEESFRSKEQLNLGHSRKEQCYACNPRTYKMKIPEERVPWEPPSKSSNIKLAIPDHLQFFQKNKTTKVRPGRHRKEIYHTKYVTSTYCNKNQNQCPRLKNSPVGSKLHNEASNIDEDGVINSVLPKTVIGKSTKMDSKKGPLSVVIKFPNTTTASKNTTPNEGKKMTSSSMKLKHIRENSIHPDDDDDDDDYTNRNKETGILPKLWK